MTEIDRQQDKQQSEREWLIAGSLMVLAVLAVGVMLNYTQPVTVPFILALFLVIIVAPMVDYQEERWKFPRLVAIGTGLLVVLLVLLVVGLVLIESIERIGAGSARYNERLIQLSDMTFDRLQQWGLEVNEALFKSELSQHIPQLIGQTAGTVTGLISQVFLVAIFAGFMLVGRESGELSGFYREIELAIRRYIATKFVISAATGLLVWLMLRMIGLEFALVFGTLSFLLNFIPSVGSIIATLLPVPVAVVQFEARYWMIILAIALPGIVQTVVGNIVEPKIMGRGLQLHPVTILLALGFWGLLWGPAGMVLAVPITASIRLVLMRYETTRNIGQLLAGKLPTAD